MDPDVERAQKELDELIKRKFEVLEKLRILEIDIDEMECQSVDGSGVLGEIMRGWYELLRSECRYHHDMHLPENYELEQPEETEENMVDLAPDSPPSASSTVPAPVPEPKGPTRRSRKKKVPKNKRREDDSPDSGPLVQSTLAPASSLSAFDLLLQSADFYDGEEVKPSEKTEASGQAFTQKTPNRNANKKKKNKKNKKEKAEDKIDHKSQSKRSRKITKPAEEIPHTTKKHTEMAKPVTINRLTKAIQVNIDKALNQGASKAPGAPSTLENKQIFVKSQTQIPSDFQFAVPSPSRLRASGQAQTRATATKTSEIKPRIGMGRSGSAITFVGRSFPAANTGLCLTASTPTSSVMPNLIYGQGGPFRSGPVVPRTTVQHIILPYSEIPQHSGLQGSPSFAQTSGSRTVVGVSGTPQVPVPTLRPKFVRYRTQKIESPGIAPHKHK